VPGRDAVLRRDNALPPATWYLFDVSEMLSLAKRQRMGLWDVTRRLRRLDLAACKVPAGGIPYKEGGPSNEAFAKQDVTVEALSNPAPVRIVAHSAWGLPV
jgi:hypothetical protein